MLVYHRPADSRHGDQAGCFGIRPYAFVLCVALVLLVLCSTAGATNLGGLTRYLRARNNDLIQSGFSDKPLPAIGDTVTFGVVPDGLGNKDLVAGTRLVWRVVAVERNEVEDGQDPSPYLKSITLALDGAGLETRPVTRLETCPPLAPAGYQPWADSELSAWLNSSERGPNGIDFSLGSAGRNGFGFLQTAFSAELAQSVILPYTDAPVDQPIVIPSIAELVTFGISCDEPTLSRTAGSAPYALQVKQGTTITDSKVNEGGLVIPLIRINTDRLTNPAGDYFESFSAKDTLDEPTIYRQPRSLTIAQKQRATLTELTSVGATLESMPDDEVLAEPARLLYQWYRLAEGQSAPVPIDAETGLAFEDGEAHPRADAQTLKGTALVDPGRYVLYCQVTHEDGVGRSGVNSAVAVVSIGTQQSAKLECSQCHSVNIRKLHQNVKGTGKVSCSLCHNKAPEGWADTKVAEKGFKDFNISCGLDDGACHGKSGAGGAWHGEDLTASHAVAMEVAVGDPATGAKVLKDYAELRKAQDGADAVAPITSNSCSGGPYSAGCHALNSTQSGFYFGSMNLLSVHNDYAKAQKSGLAKVKTTALGSAGCSACHGKDVRPTKVGKAGCAQCHFASNGTYFDKAKNVASLATCYKPMVPDGIKRAGAPGSSSDPSSSPQALLPTTISLPVQQLVGDLLGVTPDGVALEAGVAQMPQPTIGAGMFPLGSLLQGASPLVTP